MSNDSQYFGTLDRSLIGGALKSRVDQFYNFVNSSGIFRRIRLTALHYYGISPGSNAATDRIRAGGRNGQLSMMKVNHLRNIGLHILQLTTAQRPSPQPITTNSDAKSQKQATVAKGVLDYIGREKRLDSLLNQAAEMSIVHGDAFVVSTWDPNDVEYSDDGDVEIRVVSTFDAIRDPNKNSAEESDWIITREWSDRFKVAAEFTKDVDEEQVNDMRSAILGQKTKQAYDKYNVGLGNWSVTNTVYTDSEDIAKYTLWHKKTAAVPEGRQTIFLEDGTILFDGVMPFKHVTIRRIAPTDMMGSPFGYSPLFDLCVIQEAIDALYSAVATNQLTFGVQLIMAMKGQDIDFKQLSKALAFIEYANPDGKPESLNLTHTPAEVFQFIQQLEATMETISGINSVMRGDVGEEQSGSALAIVQAQAIQFMSTLQRSYAHLVEDVYTDILDLLKQFGNNKRVITIVGKFNRSMLLDFNNDDIADVDRVVVQSVSAMESTSVGRKEMAKELIAAGMIKSPEQYISVMRTGNLEPMLEGDNAEQILIRTENEAMSAGQPVYAMPTDEHSLHIREHRCVLSTPESRNNPALVAEVAEHLAAHVRFLADPGMANLLLVLGQTPLSAAAMPAPGQGYAPGQGGQPPPAGGPQKPPGEPKKEAEPPGPKMPTNPQTGQRWDPETGGGVVPDEPGQ